MNRRIIIFILLITLLIPLTIYGEIDTLWTRKFNKYDMYSSFWDIGETEVGNYLSCGWTYGEISDWDLYLVMVDLNGELLWDKEYGGDGTDFGISLKILINGAIMIGGRFSSSDMWHEDYWLLLVNDIGDTLWTETYGDSSYDVLNSALPTIDGGYAMVGFTEFGGNGDDICLVKTDSLGNMEWVHTYGGEGDEIGNSVVQTDDSGYLVVGYGDYASMLLVDSLGNEITHINDGNEYYSVTKSTDGNYVATGDWYDGYGSFYLYLKKMDADLNTIITKSYGNSGDWSIGYSIDNTGNGGYIIGGVTGNWFYEDGYVLKVDADLGKQWDITFDIPSTEVRIFSAHETSDGNYIAAGDNGDYAWLLKLGEVQDIVEDDSTNIPNNYITLTSYPNPFNTTTEIKYYLPTNQNITLEIYDLLGRKVEMLYNGKQAAGYHKINWNAKDYPSGIYFCKLASGGKRVIQEMTLLK